MYIATYEGESGAGCLGVDPWVRAGALARPLPQRVIVKPLVLTLCKLRSSRVMGG